MKNGKLKKLLALIICGSMALGMAACGSTTENTESQKESQSESEQQSQSQEPETEKTEDDLNNVDLNTTLLLALNVMYNDADSAYYGNEVGPVIKVTGDGQYTVTFDCATDLTDAAKQAGVKGLKYLTSIYIKDYAVTSGKLGASNLTSCNIKWDKIVVDGVELTITNGEAKSGIKTSGIFDTNDPINAWDGSAVAEVEVVDEEAHVINLTTGDNPQKIEVTFTLSETVFK